VDTDEGLLASYLKRKLSAHEAVETISGCRNLILGMSAAQPPALMAATADALFFLSIICMVRNIFSKLF